MTLCSNRIIAHSKNTQTTNNNIHKKPTSRYTRLQYNISAFEDKRKERRQQVEKKMYRVTSAEDNTVLCQFNNVCYLWSMSMSICIICFGFIQFINKSTYVYGWLILLSFLPCNNHLVMLITFFVLFFKRRKKKEDLSTRARFCINLFIAIGN